MISGLTIFLLWAICLAPARAGDLQGIKERGVLRHLGVPYAHFVMETAGGFDGLDVEVMKRFAEHLGVKYQLVSTNWENLFTDLTGRRWDPKKQILATKQTDVIKGDIIANGLTVLPWRQKIVSYSVPTFPTGVWLIARAASPLKPISPSGDMAQDIRAVKRLLSGHSVLTIEGTSLAGELYDLDRAQAEIRRFSRTRFINDITPAMITGMAETTLLDIPEAMVALQEYPGEIKIIGPISEYQTMAVAVAQSSTQTLNAFNDFFRIIWNNGIYHDLVKKYYPSVFLCSREFFDQTF